MNYVYYSRLYELIQKCSEKKDMAEWNNYVESSVPNGPNKPLLLCDVDLRGAYLVGANLTDANLERAELVCSSLDNAILKRASLMGAQLQDAGLRNANLENAILRDAELEGVNLCGANLNGAHLDKTNLASVDMEGVNLQNSSLCLADMSNCFLVDADLSTADLRWASINHANLSNAILMDADLRETRLIEANLSNANITGARLYGTSRENWRINGIQCNYVYWDKEGNERTPKDRDFEPGEFEDLYRSLPEITYYFSDDFTPITAIIMNNVVNSINEKNPQFELRLDSFHSRGVPHAIFTVLHKDYISRARGEIKKEYENTILRLEGEIVAFQSIIDKFVDRPNIVIEHMGHKFGDIHSGRDTVSG